MFLHQCKISFGNAQGGGTTTPYGNIRGRDKCEGTTTCVGELACSNLIITMCYVTDATFSIEQTKTDF